VRGTDGYRLEAEPLEIEIEIFVFRMIDLVHDQNDGALRTAQETGQFLVDRAQAVLGVDGEEDKIGFAHRGVGRRPHFLKQFGFALAADSARIPDDELTAPARSGNAIAGDPRLIMHNRDVAPDEPVEESRFANVRPAHDRDLAAAGCFHA
jgi:hypothetical protein